MDEKLFFQHSLLAWYKPEDRPLPWKGIQNPYHIWLSEIILQQTRVEQGMSYYLRFVETYPEIEDLASAPDDEVMKLWEGLGYYSRARNLLSAARMVVQDLHGRFPDTYSGILSLKGIGPYTAAAIASFAFNLPHAVVDGNVFRVLARFFGINTPQDSTEGKKQFTQLAESLLKTDQPGLYNQAIMDFGATVCLPRLPKCSQCPLHKQCIAFQDKRIAELPVKNKKLVKVARFFHYLVLNYEGSVFIQRREEKDIWLNLYQFPLLETERLDLDLAAIQEQIKDKEWPGIAEFTLRTCSKSFQQVLTHQVINARFWEFDMRTHPKNIPTGWLLTPHSNISKYAFPKVIDRYIQDKLLYLDFH